MSVQYSQAREIVGNFVNTVRDAQIAKGYTASDASSFTLGYLESHLVSILGSEIGSTTAKRILKQMSIMTETKQKEIDNATV